MPLLRDILTIGFRNSSGPAPESSRADSPGPEAQRPTGLALRGDKKARRKDKMGALCSSISLWGPGGGGGALSRSNRTWIDVSLRQGSRSSIQGQSEAASSFATTKEQNVRHKCTHPKLTRSGKKTSWSRAMGGRQQYRSTAGFFSGFMFHDLCKDFSCQDLAS